jgi:hypothetical protein
MEGRWSMLMTERGVEFWSFSILTGTVGSSKVVLMS